MITYLLKGATLGIAGSFLPGPFMAYLFSQSLKYGWKRSWPASFAPLFTDGPIILAVVFLLSQTPSWFLMALKIVGGLFILYLGKRAFSVTQESIQHQMDDEKAKPRSLLNAVMINALSPSPYLFWGLIGGPIFVSALRETTNQGLAFIIGNYVCLVLGFLLLIFLFSSARRLNPKMIKHLNTVSAIALICFGLYQISSGFYVILH